MFPHAPVARRPAWQPFLALGLALACVAWLLYQRNAGLHPTVFADEWYYSKMARLTPLPEAIVPSYLYLWMFGASAACGDGFLECVRIGNLAFFLAATPFVYLIARAHTGRVAAGGVALFSVLAPLNVYTAYFMPEVTYYFGFCVLSYAALRGAAWPAPAQAMAAGAILGLMSLVKVHALFLLPALCLFLLPASRRRPGAWLPRGLVAAAIAALAFFAVRFGLGWVLAGDAALSLFGPFYADVARPPGDRMALLGAAAVSARGHLMTLALLYGLPLAVLLHALCVQALRARSSPQAAHGGARGLAQEDGRGLLHLYVLLMLGSAVGVTVMYTGSLAAPGSHEGLRLHLRYYSFVFPLLAVVAAAAISARGRSGAQEQAMPWLRWLLAASLGLLVALSLYKLPGFSMNVVDGPDISGINPGGHLLRVLAGLQLLALLAWAAGLRLAPLLFLLAILPASFAASHEGASSHLAARRPATQSDLAGKFIHDKVSAAERGQVVVAGTDMNEIMRVQFHIDHPDTAVMQLDHVGPIAEYQLPLRKKWMVLLGDYQLPAHVTPYYRTPHYVVVRLPDPEPVVGRLVLSAPMDPRLVDSFDGLSHAEPWGRWSDAKQVVIHFTQPLPRRAGVVFHARAYDRNAALPFKIRVGSQTREFRLGHGMQDIGLHFDTDGTARTVVIEVPQPVSPAELGQPGDPRKLGIGISEIVITDGARRVQGAL